MDKSEITLKISLRTVVATKGRINSWQADVTYEAPGGGGSFQAGANGLTPDFTVMSALDSARDLITSRLMGDTSWQHIKRRPMYRADGERSGNIASAGYCIATKVLEVEFTHGGIYRYQNVPWRVVGGWLRADSPGSYFGQHIRSGGYFYERVA